MNRTTYLVAAALCGASLLGCSGDPAGGSSDTFPAAAFTTLSSQSGALSLEVRTAPTQPLTRGIDAIEYSFDAGPVAAVTASYTGTLDASINGADLPGSARTQLRFALSGGYSLNDQWRMQASVFGDPPARHFGQNQPSGVGGSVALFRVW